MTATLTLLDVIKNLRTYPTAEEQGQLPTIYVAEPWSAASEALVDWEPMKGGLPPNAATRGLTRLREVRGAVGILAAHYDEFTKGGRYAELCDLLIKGVKEQNARGRPYTFADNAP